MQRPIWRLGAALAVALGIVAACGGGEKPDPEEPELLITATPRQINDQGQISQIDVTARNADGTAGTGSVVLKASAGTFSSGGTEETVTLANGKGSASFLCNKGADPKCVGNVRIDGTWGTTTASTTLSVGAGGTTDGGKDGGTTGGSDGGRDGGSDGGTDPGTGTFRVLVETAKPLLVANTGDQTVVTATVTRVNGGAAEPGVQVAFNTTIGSFTPTAGTTTAQATTNSAGKAEVTLYVANTQPGTARITATHGDGTGVKDVPFSAVSAMSYVTGSAKALLGRASSGRETSTLVSFKVINAAQQPVPNVDVTFEVSGAAGASVTPSAVTDTTGVASTTLRSGDSVGVAIVKATVTATLNQTPTVSANHPGTPIVGGKPSDKGIAIDCTKRNLGALHQNPPPRTNLTTNCTLSLRDRDLTVVGLSTPVQWYPEAGATTSPVNSVPQNGPNPAANTGAAVTLFTTTGKFPPTPVTPWPGERFSGSADVATDPNPRDMAVTVIAVVGGEEEFFDGSGTGPTQDQQNGRWDPGEWFVDLGEPLVDNNDNGVWDPGEFFIDTQRIDCANPNAPPTTNSRWDGPNGCWDSDTQLWRAVHIVYSGPMVQGFELNPPQPQGGYTVPLNSFVDINFRWTDAYFNQMSVDGATFTITKSGTRGNAAVIGGTPVAFGYGGFNVDYTLRKGTTQPDGTLSVSGVCDPSEDTPAGSSTSPVRTRCVRVTDYTFLAGGNTGRIRLTGATTAGTPVTSTVELKANHSFSTSSSAPFTATFE
jgi:hypothetical protein